MSEINLTKAQVIAIIFCIVVLTAVLFTALGYEYGAQRMAANLNNYVYVRSVTDADNTNISICYNKVTNQMYYYENDRPYAREPIWIFEDNVMRPAYYPEDN